MYLSLKVFTEPVTRGMAALLQSSVEGIEWSSEVKVNYFASPEEVLDEGEGLDMWKIFLSGRRSRGRWRCGDVVSGQGRPSASQT